MIRILSIEVSAPSVVAGSETGLGVACGSTAEGDDGLEGSPKRPFAALRSDLLRCGVVSGSGRSPLCSPPVGRNVWWRWAP